MVGRGNRRLPRALSAVLFGRRLWVLLAVAGVLIGTTLGAWRFLNEPAEAPDIRGLFHGAAYQPYRKDHSPTGAQPTVADIDADLALLAGHMRAVRTYSSLGALAALPALAEEYGLEVVQGIWVDGNRARARREIEAGVPAAASASVTRILVGNEALLRGDLNVPELVGYLREVRQRTGKPVSTAEPWSVWLSNPGLAQHVDFIAIHVLPYWEETTTDAALAYAIDKIEQVRKRFPDKPVVVAEVGWPSDGRPRWNLKPGPATQASVRAGHPRPYRAGGDRDVPHGGVRRPVEIHDRRQGRRLLGSVRREPAAEIPARGTHRERPHWPMLAALSIAIGMVGLLWLAARSPNRTRSFLFQGGAIFAAASAALWLADLSLARYFTLPGAVVWGGLLSLMALLILVPKTELAEVFGTVDRPPRVPPGSGRLGRGTSGIDPPADPSRAARHGRRNASRPRAARLAGFRGRRRRQQHDRSGPVASCRTGMRAAQCQPGPGRFKFIHVEGMRGYKAGALNLALRHTRADAAAIGVIDADYIVDPQWLRRAMPYFDDPRSDSSRRRRTIATCPPPRSRASSAGNMPASLTSAWFSAISTMRSSSTARWR